MKATKGGRKKRETLRLTMPKRGEAFLFVECDLKKLKESFEIIVQDIRRRDSVEEINTVVDYAFDYTVKHIDQLIGAALMRVQSEAFDDAWRKIGRVRGDPLTTHKALLKLEDQEARERLNFRSVGQPSRWTTNELANAVQDALESLSAQRKTYPKVTALLKKRYPEKAPKTSEALRKLLDRHNINWMKFKSGQYSIP
jgi:hypothetical protein